MKALIEQKRMKVNPTQELYKKKGSEMDGEFKKNLKTQLQIFQQSLEHFLTNNRKEINKDPNLRQEFYNLCREIGFDPLICNNQTASKGVLKTKTEDLQFLNDVAVQITNVCLGLRSRTGGLIQVEDCLKWVNKLRGERHSITLHDLYSALNTLNVFGNGLRIIEGQSKMILSVPLELNLDQKQVIDKSNALGYVDSGMFPEWNTTRFTQAVVSSN